MDKKEKENWDKLARHLNYRSEEIEGSSYPNEDIYDCVYAYVTEHGFLIDICLPCYFLGWGSDDMERFGNYAAVPLPWYGTGEELKEFVEIRLPTL